MGLPTKEEQQDVLDWYEKQRGGMTTDRITKGVIQAIRSMFIVEKLNISAEDAHKAWTTAQRLEKRLQRALAASSSAYQMDVKE